MATKPLDRTPTQKAQVAADKAGCDYVMLGHGRFALVDRGSRPEIMTRLWNYQVRGYAARLAYTKGSPVRIVYLHRAIAGDIKGVIYDHVNRDKLDNRLENIRRATQSQNAGNISKRRSKQGATSKYKGVSFDNWKKRWLAQGNNGGKMVFLGRFKDEAIAARNYDNWAKNHFGEFAYLNFP